MGDRTALQATVYACPAVERVHVAEILAEYFGPGGYWDDIPAGGAESVALGEQYTAPEVSCGSADELGDKLAEVPGISFVLWEDPKYEYLGDIRAHTPELGLFAAECDANGSVCLSPAEIRAAVESATDAVHAALSAPMPMTGDEQRLARAAVAAVLAEIDRKTGKPWFDAMQAGPQS